MKTAILSAAAAVAFALSTGVALAGPADYPTGTDNGFAVYQQDQKVSAGRAFLAGSDNYPTGTDNGFAVYQQDQKANSGRSYLSGANYPTGTDNGFAVYLQDEKVAGH